MSQAMTKLVQQHRECDDQLTRCEAALHKGDVDAAGRIFFLFSTELDNHFALEEERLFPAFEQATGMTSGPTVVMRGEHVEIRALRDEAKAALADQRVDDALGAIDTLNVLIQQHNVKEENILYPMCDERVANLGALLGFAGGGCGGGCSCG
jgi:iron-sulfur cluster repair protein YtfE (RIC family)